MIGDRVQKKEEKIKKFIDVERTYSEQKRPTKRENQRWLVPVHPDK